MCGRKKLKASGLERPQQEGSSPELNSRPQQTINNKTSRAKGPGTQ